MASGHVTTKTMRQAVSQKLASNFFPLRYTPTHGSRKHRTRVSTSSPERLQEADAISPSSSDLSPSLAIHNNQFQFLPETTASRLDTGRIQPKIQTSLLRGALHASGTPEEG
mmetsp:Transcript_12204/g.31044  ORF Transcript_12204/g.31044 Transcript_12204/m.31044 type:complete len:112 (-) Transcript_12204:109-444(-)